MTPALIHKTFDKLLEKGSKARAARRAMGMSSNTCCYLRWRIKHYNDVRLQTKMKWLEKAGYDLGKTDGYSRADMVAFARFCALPKNARGLKLGYAYLMDKWEATNARKTFIAGKK